MLYHKGDLDAACKDHHSFSFANTDYDSGYIRTDHRVMGGHDYTKRSHNMRTRTWPSKNSGDRYGSEFQSSAGGDDGPSPSMMKVIPPPGDGKTCPSTSSETIAKYQKEMMELVRDVPESGYDLSLRDIVELPKIVKDVKEDVIKEEQQEKVKEMPIKGKRKQLFRNQTFPHNPVMLNVFLSINYRKSSSGLIVSKVCGKPQNEKSGVEMMNTSGKSRNNNRNESDGDIGSNNNKCKKKTTGCFPLIPTITCFRNKGRRPHTLT